MRTKHLIHTRVPRLVVSGGAFQGKTCAVRDMERRLRQAVPGAVILSETCQVRSAPEDRLVSLLPDAAREPRALDECLGGHGVRMGEKIKELARTASKDWVLLVLDEAHLLDTVQDEYLRDLQGALSKFDIRLIAVLIGQPQVLHLNEKRVSQRRAISRIMPVPLGDEMHFRGLRSMHDMAISLVGYDKSYFPEESGWSYTRFFVPYAHAAGLRMEDHATTLWRIFLELHIRAHVSWEIEVPMYHFCRAVEHALLNSSTLDQADFTITRPMWQQAVAYCGYADYLEIRRKIAAVEGL